MIIVSACLAGYHCTYKGGSAPAKHVIELVKQGKAVPVCPEQLAGFGTPRLDAEIKDGRVYELGGRDITEMFEKGAQEVLRIAKQYGCKEAILKARSPSCGCGIIRDGTFQGGYIKGDGWTAKKLKENGIKVYGDEENPYIKKEAPFKGTIIEESLENQKVLKKVKIIKTKVEQVVEKHKTPWIKQWTLHSVEIDSDKAERIATKISESLETKHNWYADFKNKTHHYIIFRNKVFFIDKTSKKEYDEAKEYGIALGIPPYQVDFHPEVKNWKR